MNTTEKYLYPTPGGAFYLTQNTTDSWEKVALLKLFTVETTPLLNNDFLESMFMTSNVDDIESKLNECQKQKIIQVIDHKIKIDQQNWEDSVQKLIGSLSKNNKALLSDSQGFCLSNCGFSTNMSEEISVLSADIAIMHKRRALEINKKLELNSQAWAIVDASGNSQLGFWPLNIQNEVFVLAIEGPPFFNQDKFILLIWLLYLRYGNE